MVIHGTTSRLDDENILASHRVLNLAASLADRKFAQYTIPGRDSKHIAHRLREGWVRVPGEDDNVSNHLGDLIREEKAVSRKEG